MHIEKQNSSPKFHRNTKDTAKIYTTKDWKHHNLNKIVVLVGKIGRK